jgi:hypothetical protein
VIRIQGVWLLGLATLDLSGSIESTLGYLPLPPAVDCSSLGRVHCGGRGLVEEPRESPM